MTRLALDHARIGMDSATLLEGVTFEVEGGRIALLGAVEPLFLLASNQASLLGGRAELDGLPLSRTVASGVVGLAQASPRFPPGWTVERTLFHSAALTGLSRGNARDAALAALARVALPHLASRRFETLTLSERRGLMLAHACLTDPKILAIETPLAGLDGPGEELVMRVLSLACEGREALISFHALGESGAARALFDTMDQAVSLQGGAVVACGEPATALGQRAHFVLTVGSNAAELVKCLTARGLTVNTATAERRLIRELRGPELPGRLVVTGGGEDLVEQIVNAAVEADAPLFELLPSDH